MKFPKPLILASMISLALITVTAASNMPTPSYAQTQFSAILTGASVFPPVQTNATGKAMLDLVGGGQVMKYNISGTNVDHVNNVVITHST